jgi:hypothetical protein
MTLGRAGLATVAALVATVGLAACDGNSPSDLAPAPGAGTPACAGVLERAPERVLDRDRSEQQAVGVAAWGDPPVVLQCGVDLPAGPTSDPCMTVNGVDWIVDNADDEEAPATFLSYGRSPGVRVTVPGERQRAADALVDLGPAVAPLPASKHCQ